MKDKVGLKNIHSLLNFHNKKMEEAYRVKDYNKFCIYRVTVLALQELQSKYAQEFMQGDD